MTAAVVIRLARRLDWLSSYRSVSSTISSAMISSMISVCYVWRPVMLYEGYVVGVIELRHTFEGDHSNRTAGHTGSITNEQEVRATSLVAIGDGMCIKQT